MKILILESIHQDGIDRLCAESHTIEIALGITRKDLLSRIAVADVIIIKSVIQVDEELLRFAKNLRVIGRAGVGTDNIDKVAVAQRGIEILLVPGGNADAGADFTVMQILCLLRNAYDAQKMIAVGDYRRDLLLGRDLNTITVGIIGLGNVGYRVATRLKAFGCRLLGYNPNLSLNKSTEIGVELVTDIEVLLRDIDVLTIHVPLTPLTRNLITSKEFNMMKPGLVLVNTSRGAIINEQDLIEAVHSGVISKAAVDVFDDEPPFDALPDAHQYDNLLLHEPDIISTPHIGASTLDAQRNISINLAGQLIGYFNSQSTTSEEK